MIAQDIVGGAANDNATPLLRDFFENCVLSFDSVFSGRSGEIKFLRNLLAVVTANFLDVFLVKTTLGGSEGSEFFVVIRDAKLFCDELADFLTL